MIFDALDPVGFGARVRARLDRRSATVSAQPSQSIVDAAPVRAVRMVVEAHRCGTPS